MKRVTALMAILAAMSGTAYCGGEAETGRGTAAETVSQGQLLPVGSIDPGNYLSDFESDVTNTGTEPLRLEATLMKPQVWEKGGYTAFRIVLAANEESYFRPTPGLFVMFFQNPELLRDEEFVNELALIIDRSEALDIRIFDATSKRLHPASSAEDFLRAVSMLKGQRKIYEQNKLIQRALETMSDNGAARAHLLWITDENIAERPADLNFFKFAVELLAGADTTFSYLAYGELPNWPSINEMLLRRNGNTYYAKDHEEIIEKTERDLSYFRRPAVEDIEVTIILSRTVSQGGDFYPSWYYGSIPNFHPVFKNNRPRWVHSLGGMNYGEIKRFIHYVTLPSYLSLIELADPTPLLQDTALKVGSVFVGYYLPMEDRWIHLVADLTVEYVGSEYVAEIEIDKMVELDTIIQNTPLILLEAALLTNNSRNYLLALKLLQAQIDLLKTYGSARPDTAIEEDIETLERYYRIVFDQAKAVNLLE